jgi:hypothetical protein
MQNVHAVTASGVGGGSSGCLSGNSIGANGLFNPGQSSTSSQSQLQQQPQAICPNGTTFAELLVR